MTTLLKKILLATLFLAIAAVVFVLVALIGTNDSSKEIGDGAMFPPTGESRGTVERGSNETPLPQPDEKRSTTTKSSALSQDQLDYLRGIIMNAHMIPSPKGEGDRWYFLSETPTYRLNIVVHEEGNAVVDVSLLQAPYYVARRHAESVFSELFGGERDDLCGFPFYVHVDSDPEFKERGNLGLEYCGENKLAETE